MQPNPITSGPVFDGSYTPYFYQSGRFLAYGQPAGQSRAGILSQGYAYYDFSSDPQPWANEHSGQTIEQIIAHGYFAVPAGEPETALISDKKQTSWLGLEDTIRQIRNRYDLYHRNMYELHQGVCEADNAVFRQAADQGAPADNRQKYSANKLIQGLYEQMRVERVRLWQDVSRIRQDLPETAQGYLSAHRKMAVLHSDSGGDLP